MDLGELFNGLRHLNCYLSYMVIHLYAVMFCFIFAFDLIYTKIKSKLQFIASTNSDQNSAISLNSISVFKIK
jgi:hypothetical protein